MECKYSISGLQIKRLIIITKFGLKQNELTFTKFVHRFFLAQSKNEHRSTCVKHVTLHQSDDAMCTICCCRLRCGIKISIHRDNFLPLKRMFACFMTCPISKSSFCTCHLWTTAYANVCVAGKTLANRFLGILIYLMG